MDWHVYILFSEKIDRFYVGRTSNIELRLEQHAAGMSQYTKAGIPWLLLWYCTKPTEYQAHLLERKLKNLTRKRKTAFMLRHKEGISDAEMLLKLRDRFSS